MGRLLVSPRPLPRPNHPGCDGTLGRCGRLLRSVMGAAMRSPDRNREYMREYMRQKRLVNSSKPRKSRIVNTLADSVVNTLAGSPWAATEKRVNSSNPHESRIPAFSVDSLWEAGGQAVSPLPDSPLTAGENVVNSSNPHGSRVSAFLTDSNVNALPDSPKAATKNVVSPSRPRKSRVSVRFKLRDLYGDPPTNGGGILAGDGTADELVADLRDRYGSRLISLEVL